MPFFVNKYPYTDFHELNLDWIISKIKEVKEAVIVAVNSANAASESEAAAAGSEAAAADSASAAAASAEDVHETVDGAIASIETAGQTQVNAVNTAGQTVINSIPADYTTLSNTVDALNSKRTDTVNLANCTTIEEVVNAMKGKYLGYAKVGNGDSSNFKTLVGNVVSGSYYSAYVNWVNDAIVAENGYVLKVTAIPNIVGTNDYGVYVKYLYRHGARDTYGQTVWVNVAKMT